MITAQIKTNTCLFTLPPFWFSADVPAKNGFADITETESRSPMNSRQ
jgi:hypothetical protein